MLTDSISETGRTFGPNATAIAFPLGGIGTGNVSLGARGDLRDWEIFNHPDKGNMLPFTFFAIRTHIQGQLPIARVIEGALQPPYLLSHGYHSSTTAGLPRFSQSNFRGEYPFATVDFPIQTCPQKFNSAPEQWFEGQHQAIISQDLFDLCQEIRAKRAVHRQPTPKYNPYLLRDLIYCYRCCANAPTEYSFPSYGKLRAHCQTNKYGEYRCYRCRARNFNRHCEQKGVLCDLIESQVIQTLMQLKPPAEWRKNITTAMSEILGEQNLEDRLAQIKEAIERMDFRWDQGFITDKMDYLEKRVKLQQELEQLTPIPEDDLARAADMLENFEKHWKACEGDPEAEYKLIKLIVDRVYVQDEQVVAITMKADYHVVLGHNESGSIDISIDPGVYTFGSDGHGTLTGYAILPRKTEYQRVVKVLLAVA